MLNMDIDPPERPPRKPLLIGLAGMAVCAAMAAAFIAWCFYLKARHAGPTPILIGALVYSGLVFGVASLTALKAQKAGGQRLSLAAKRYTRRFLVGMSGYVVLLVVALNAFVTLRPTGPLAYALAVAPAIPLVGCIAVIGLYLKEEQDEFVRAVASQSALAACGGVLAIATVWGFLEQFHLAPHVPGWATFPLWAVLFGACQPLIRRRYQ
jgi:hypothetical protein